MPTRTLPHEPPHANGTTASATPPITNGSNGTGHEGRGADGRFTKGWKGGSGNPHARKVASLRMQFLEAISPELMRRFVHDVARLAGRGSIEHAQLFLRYALGDPLPPVDPDTLDAHELLLLRQINQGTLEAGGKCLDGAAAVAAVKALMRAGLRKALATGKLADLLVRADVQAALAEAGLGDVVAEANTLRGRLK
jgi:hypothetical protein